MPVLEERVISGKGLLKVPQNDDLKKAKILTLQAVVIRRPTNEYLNYSSNPPKSFYANITALRGGMVCGEYRLDYPEQSWDMQPEGYLQNLYAIQCAYDGVLKTFVNLGLALVIPPIAYFDGIKDWRHNTLFPDEFRVVCYASTGIKLVLRSISYDLCEEQEEPNPNPPPPPPEEEPPVPPDQPLDDTTVPVSPPYDGNDDDGNTVPFPLDEEPAPPDIPGSPACALFTVAYSYKFAFGSAQTDSRNFYGRDAGIEMTVDSSNVVIVSRGQVGVNPTCSETDVFTTIASNPPYGFDYAYIDSIVPYSP